MYYCEGCNRAMLLHEFARFILVLLAEGTQNYKIVNWPHNILKPCPNEFYVQAFRKINYMIKYRIR